MYNAIIIVINTFIFDFCWMLLRDFVVKSPIISKQSEIMCG